MALIGIALITLTPGEGEGHRAFQWRPNLRPEHLVEDALNVILFIPLGIALRWLGAEIGRVLLASTVVSVTIELAQRYLIPGRSGALDDIVTNALGGLLGAVVAALVGRAATR